MGLGLIEIKHSSAPLLCLAQGLLSADSVGEWVPQLQPHGHPGPCHLLL